MARVKKPGKISEATFAWMAGILDLKGAVVRKVNKERATAQIVLYVQTKNVKIIDMLSRLTGTMPEPQNEKNIHDWMRKGCDEHCPEKHIHVNSEGYPWKMPSMSRWTITGAAAAVVLFNTVPFMRTDHGLKEAMQVILDQTVVSGRGSGATKAALKRLRDLGWVLPPQFEGLDLDGPGSS